MEINRTNSVDNNTNKAIKVAAGTTAAVGLIGAGIIAGNKTDAFVRAKEALTNSNVKSKITETAKNILKKAQDIGKSLKDNLPKLGLADKVKNVFTPVKNFITAIPGNVVKFASSVADKVKTGFNSIKFNPDAFKNIFKK
jgi:hypothetical protein